jgi:hypothetical protein
MMIPQREETGIYEDHPGLNPTYERDLGEDFERICSELYHLFYLSPDRDLPPSSGKDYLHRSSISGVIYLPNHVFALGT